MDEPDPRRSTAMLSCAAPIELPLTNRLPQVPCLQSPPSPEPRSLAGRPQAVRPWCLLTQDIATSSKGLFPWRTKNRANRRTAPIP